MISEGLISTEKVNGILEEWFDMIKLYNNNYRPIYHLERIFYKILVSVHEIQ